MHLFNLFRSAPQLVADNVGVVEVHSAETDEAEIPEWRPVAKGDAGFEWVGQP